MSLRRFLAPLPASYDLPQMRTLTLGRYASAVDVNAVDNGDGTQSLAVYLTSAPTPASLAAWQADVAAAVVQHPTADELAATTSVNAATLTSKAQTALASNATFQGQTAPTVGSLAQAQTAVNAIWAQMQTQSKELSAIIRLLIGALDSTSGT